MEAESMDVNSMDANTWFRAILNNDVELVRKYMSNGWDVDLYHDEMGMTALMIASMGGHIELVKLLLEGPDQSNKIGLSRFVYQTEWCAHPEYRSTCGTTALMQACRFGHQDIIQMLLATGKSHPEYRDSDGHSALFNTISGHLDGIFNKDRAIEIIRLLIETGSAHPEYMIDNKSIHQTPLMHCCCENGNQYRNDPSYTSKEIVQMLLDTGSSRPEAVSAYGFAGYTALMYACCAGDIESARLLLAAGSAHPENREESGKTALDLVLEKGTMHRNYYDLIQLLNPCPAKVVGWISRPIIVRPTIYRTYPVSYPVSYPISYPFYYF